ncbi:MAG: carbamoyltransferase N-terminal domain-containing protein, partial [Verrucomicrobiota bacterium]
MNVLGFNNFASHDPSASIVTDRNGTLEYVAIAEERLCRVKKSHYSPLRSIRYCMDHFGIKDFSEVDLIVVDYVFHKQLTDTANHYRKLEHDYIKTKLKLDYNKLLYIDSHHMAHAASAYYPSNFKEAAILIVDGFGSNVETNSLFVGNSQGIRLIEQAHGIGIGLVYEVVTSEILGFARGQEGKTMGLAALGRDIKGDAILHLQPVYKGMVTDFSHFIDRAPREMLKQAIPACPQPSEVTNDFYSKIAFEVQEEAERCMVHLANYAYEKTGMKNLCIAGGVGLNCLANSAIIDQTPFENVFIQPASSDVGLSLGLALHGYSRQSTQTFSFNVYTGKNYAASETETLLQKFNIPYKQIEIPKVAQL